MKPTFVMAHGASIDLDKIIAINPVKRRVGIYGSFDFSIEFQLRNSAVIYSFPQYPNSESKEGIVYYSSDEIYKPNHSDNIVFNIFEEVKRLSEAWDNWKLHRLNNRNRFTSR